MREKGLYRNVNARTCTKMREQRLSSSGTHDSRAPLSTTNDARNGATINSNVNTTSIAVSGDSLSCITRCVRRTQIGKRVHDHHYRRRECRTVQIRAGLTCGRKQLASQTPQRHEKQQRWLRQHHPSPQLSKSRGPSFRELDAAPRLWCPQETGWCSQFGAASR